MLSDFVRPPLRLTGIAKKIAETVRPLAAVNESFRPDDIPAVHVGQCHVSVAQGFHHCATVLVKSAHHLGTFRLIAKRKRSISFPKSSLTTASPKALALVITTSLLLYLPRPS